MGQYKTEGQGCEHLNREHAWERVADGCTQICSICGKEREEHVWMYGACALCGLKMASIMGLPAVRLSWLTSAQERDIVNNALTYALINWGDSGEELAIKALITKVSRDEDLDKDDVRLLDRVYRELVRLFPDNAELRIEGVFLLLDHIAPHMA